MFPPFPQEKAFAACRQMVADLASGALAIEQLAPPSRERAAQGVMLGALICTDGNGRELTLQCLSGTSHTLRPHLQREGTVCVPPIASAEAIAAALEPNDAEIHLLTERLMRIRGKAAPHRTPTAEERTLAARRAALTTESLQHVFSLYSFHCADGSVRTLHGICAERNKGAFPPTGTGDCCAPKLLDYAFAHALTPLSLCEVYYNYNGRKNAKTDAIIPRPPCNDRCGIILPAMLGLEILYRDDDIIVVNKQSGLLSVPGRGPDKQDCVVNRLRRLFPDCITQPAVHRLDMETSGLLVLAFTTESHRELCRQFQEGEVGKQYVALLDGVLPEKGIAPHGRLELFFRLDVEHRPHQIWDAEHGKKAVTEWQTLGVERYHAPDGTVRHATRVLFTPHTGRTHQLRLASADSHGFGVPIIGDALYGSCSAGERLLLHAQSLSLTHPSTGQRLTFTCPCEF